MALRYQLDRLQWRTNILINNSAFVGLTTVFGKGFYLNFEDRIEFKHKNKQLISDTLKMFQFVWENVFKLSITPLDDYNVNILKESTYENDGAFLNIVFDETTRQCRLANERNVHEYLHSILGNQKPIINQSLNNNNSNNNSNNDGNNNAAYAVTVGSQRGNSAQWISGLDLEYEEKKDRMIKNINQLDLKQFETTGESLGYFIVFFQFFQKNDSINDNNNNNENNEHDRYGKIEEIFYKQNENKNNKNIWIENVYQMNDNNNIYCIVISSFALQLSFKLQYDFGTFLYDPQVGEGENTTLKTGISSSSYTNGGDGKSIVFERKSFVLFCLGG